LQKDFGYQIACVVTKQHLQRIELAALAHFKRSLP